MLNETVCTPSKFNCVVACLLIALREQIVEYVGDEEQFELSKSKQKSINALSNWITSHSK